MTRSGFFLVVCFTAAVVLGSLAIAANPGSDNTPTIENTLAVQKAVLEARDCLMRGETKKAVEVLETNLPRINGDRKFLALLRDAYRAHVKDLALANQPALVDVYQKRLKILEDSDPTAPVAVAARVDPPQVIGSSDPPRQMVAAKDARPQAAAPAMTVRGKVDPFDPANEMKPAITAPGQQDLVKALLVKADAEFNQKRYDAAKPLYEQASQADPKAVPEDARKRWAYCQLALVVEQVNRFPDQPCDWTRLESDVKTAVAVAPHLSKAGGDILADIAKRRALAPAPVESVKIAAAVVKHLPRGDHGWLTAETTHFRVLHNQAPEFAEKVAQVAEATRVLMSRKWFGKDGDEWSPRCDIYLHANSADYSEQTGQHPSSPGYSRIDLDPTSGRVVVRQVHLRCDNPALLEAVLPHESTHVVLAGQFGNKHVPRWVDEGVAVLTEPAEKVDQHRKNLARSLQNRELIPLRELLQMDSYPKAQQISVFYAQSVALVDFLTARKGPTVFTQFVRDALQGGYEPALRKHYGMQDIGELQDRFTERVLAEVNGGQPAYAER